MKKVMDWFERLVVYALLVLMMLIILLALAGFIIILVQDVSQRPVNIFHIDQILEFFGYVLLVLIGVELLDTIRAYLQEHVVHVEVVLEVALIAVARKIIILELKEVSPGTLFGIAALVAVLALAFFLEKRGRKLAKKSEIKPLAE
jgi:uncharacterized membrane protein (DUF373 family)